MAEKKTTEETAAVSKTEETAGNHDGLVEIKLPRVRGGENCVRVSMNDRPQFTIMRGVSVKVPEWVAEIIANSELAEEAADAYISTLVTPK